ncbi:2-oxo-4-hydroxy-4-carboxy-5-ureidoimidazoline decarboxylase [Promicromonospora thailandica]|uniref:2-oxo-4-hydroxy-4-carboxy-5-ureidoimidazoline decarboxylase n=1 Tax=Promicromonospora thailandica TaxID=765201 RepID=A0A9X2G2L9_9MICO|nr:2-oxo-4-hydroxy-4-carboxy-5-ureidoimidazoline decarboxylase [Promicromonospora thailandica]MCP2264162.1 2-oxo-4-hydroxy-4-carboxy-5-ureidoimidazoline decarboxylase [Promicromonospora thailandica]BFF21170.1 2-oxo-4-hydroxy-4-carboxy-5-ureidoimidazoline decarboxylase [Promicromonospora thailandica]
MDLATFNALPAPEAASAIRPCADITPWVDDVVAGRPYACRDALLLRAMRAAGDWSAADVDAALARHPRIGERASGTDAEARLSRGEQPVAAQETAARIAAGNAAYEERFGRIFLVRAAGRTAEEILANLTERLANDPATEALVTAEQLRQIALLRLESVVEPA